METPVEMCSRLLTALEDLIGQEAAALQARDFRAAISIQDRSAPLVENLAAHADEIIDPQLRARLAKLYARRNQTGEWLAEQIARTREQLREAEAHERRIVQIAPIYGRALGAQKHLCVLG